MNTRELKCPTCQTSLLWSTANPHRPFCSERCKLIDLGEWASGDRHIPGRPLTDTDLADIDNVDDLRALLATDDPEHFTRH